MINSWHLPNQIATVIFNFSAIILQVIVFITFFIGVSAGVYTSYYVCVGITVGLHGYAREWSGECYIITRCYRITWVVVVYFRMNVHANHSQLGLWSHMENERWTNGEQMGWGTFLWSQLGGEQGGLRGFSLYVQYTKTWSWYFSWHARGSRCLQRGYTCAILLTVNKFL